MTTKEVLVSYIRAGYPAVWLRTAEELRAVRVLKAAGEAIGELPDQEPMPVLLWSFTKGWHGKANGIVGKAQGKPDEALEMLDPIRPEQAGPRVPENAIAVLLDFHPFFDMDNGLIRKFRDILPLCKESGTLIVLLSPVVNLKPEYESEVLTLELPLPDGEELGHMMDEGIISQNPRLKALGAKLYGVPREAVLEGLAGLTLLEAENVLSLAIIRHGSFTEEALRTIHREKANVLKKNGLLRYKETALTMDDVGGLDSLKTWFTERMAAFSPEAIAAGLPRPKGVLIVGVQGCGKSLTAKALANLWRKPLIEASVGDWMDSLVGGSERKAKEALATVDAIGPSILYLDEFEKMAQGTESSGRTDGGTTSRVLKEFLTWLNDREGGAFVCATVNRIDALPAEILRKGRFDEIFFVDLPQRSERQAIFAIHLKRNRLDPIQFDLEALADKAAGFSGAEIEQAVIAARYRAFAQKKHVTTADILGAIGSTKPLSVTMADQITAVRERLKDVAVPASAPESAAAAPEVKGGRKLKG